MALFKKRSSPSSADEGNAVPPAPAAVDPLRRRARHRLIGATILVIAAVVCLPWLFDAPPPAVSTQVPISIGGQESVVVANATPPTPTPAPAITPAPPPVAAPVASAVVVPVAPAPTPTPVQAAPAPKPQPASATPPAPAPAPVVAARTETPPKPATPTPAPAPAPAQPPPPKPAAAESKPDTLDALIAQRQAQESAKPAATKPAAAATAKPAAPASTTPPVNYDFPETGRFVVQVGAFVEANKVASVRQQLSRAGLANFTQQVTINGKQVTRVRMGPFTTRKQMEQAAAKVRALGLPVSLYQL